MRDADEQWGAGHGGGTRRPQDDLEALRREAEENWNKYVRLAAEYRELP